jgi:hypothetical protein
VLGKSLRFNGEFEDLSAVLVERKPSQSAHGATAKFAAAYIAVVGFIEFKI